MRQTIANYLGGLPPQFFTVEISAKGEDLAQLMYNMMMTGYMFRNGQYKLELRNSMLPQGQHAPQQQPFSIYAATKARFYLHSAFILLVAVVPDTFARTAMLWGSFA